MSISPASARIPESISPLVEYLCSSLMSLRKSGLYLTTSFARTLSSYLTFSFSRMNLVLSKKCEDSSFFSLPSYRKSRHVHLEWRGSITLFLKLQVRTKRQLFANSSMNPRRAGCILDGFA